MFRKSWCFEKLLKYTKWKRRVKYLMEHVDRNGCMKRNVLNMWHGIAKRNKTNNEKGELIWLKHAELSIKNNLKNWAELAREK